MILSFLLLGVTLLQTCHAQGDWSSDWAEARTLDRNVISGDSDPLDVRSKPRGSGTIHILGDGIAQFLQSPRLYVEQEAGVSGWENVEMTAYAMFVNTEGAIDFSGFTMAARSNHDVYAEDGCEARGYYGRIYLNTGECAFQKEYFHGDSGTVYTRTNRVNCFSGGLPLNVWIGMKFIVTTIPGTQDVQLELYTDTVGDGSWQLRHSLVDTPGSWLSSDSTTVPPSCPFLDGDTVLGPRNVCFFRTDGRSANTEVRWRDASIINQLSPTGPTDPPAPTASPFLSPSPPPVPVDCEVFTDNQSCNSNAQCSWSGKSKSCAGPSGNTTPAPAPVPSPTQTSAPVGPPGPSNCEQYTNNKDCTSDAQCGWSGKDKKCSNV